jgi:hypothetical protein
MEVWQPEQKTTPLDPNVSLQYGQFWSVVSLAVNSNKVLSLHRAHEISNNYALKVKEARLHRPSLLSMKKTIQARNTNL